MLCWGEEREKKTEKMKNENQGQKNPKATTTRSKVMVMGGRGVGSIGSWAELVGDGREWESPPAKSQVRPAANFHAAWGSNKGELDACTSLIASSFAAALRGRCGHQEDSTYVDVVISQAFSVD